MNNASNTEWYIAGVVYHECARVRWRSDFCRKDIALYAQTYALVWMVSTLDSLFKKENKEGGKHCSRNI